MSATRRAERRSIKYRDQMAKERARAEALYKKRQSDARAVRAKRLADAARVIAREDKRAAR